jgi:hypothetical protein
VPVLSELFQNLNTPGKVKGVPYWHAVFNNTPSECPRVLKGRQIIDAYLKKDEEKQSDQKMPQSELEIHTILPQRIVEAEMLLQPVASSSSPMLSSSSSIIIIIRNHLRIEHFLLFLGLLLVLIKPFRNRVLNI